MVPGAGAGGEGSGAGGLLQGHLVAGAKPGFLVLLPHGGWRQESKATAGNAGR